MMLERIKSDPYFYAAILITIANVLLIWAFRFLPLYDYPIWLYEVRIMRALADPMFVDVYEIADVPVPNLGFVGIVYLLSFIVSIEVAGKIFLTICIVGLPWSFWYAARKLANNPNTPIAFAAFPFAFNIYFYGGQAFLLGLIVLLLMVGSYFRRLDKLSVKDWAFLSSLFLLSYFIHAVSFVLAAIIFGGAVITVLRPKLYAFTISLIPSLACLIWYFVSNDTTSIMELKWSQWGLAQNVFKPVFLFIKSYGIANPLPLTLMNVLCASLILFLIFQLFTKAKRNNRVEKTLVFPVVLMALFVLMLPEIFFGIVQPGSRFGLPLLFFILLMLCRVDISERWKSIFLSIALLVNVYNTFHFRRIDEQMQMLFSDITTTVNVGGTRFLSIRFDWPPERAAWDVAATSIDPLFGGMYYAAFSSGGPTKIFETSLLRIKDAHKELRDEPTGSTLEELSSSLLAFNKKYFGNMVLVGKNDLLEKTYEQFLRPSSWFVCQKNAAMWKILGGPHPEPGLRIDTNK